VATLLRDGTRTSTGASAADFYHSSEIMHLSDEAIVSRKANMDHCDRSGLQGHRFCSPAVPESGDSFLSWLVRQQAQQGTSIPNVFGGRLGEGASIMEQMG
jgi:hypothetical protein